MKKLRIFISGPAKKDILRVVRHIRLDKPAAAEKFKILLKNKIRSLDLFYLRGRKVPELKGTPLEDYREIIVAPCRILYKVTRREIWILRVLHSRKEFSLFD